MSTPESNGHARVPAEGSPAADAPDPPAPEPEIGDLDDVDDDDLTDDDSASGIEIAFTPRQILGGFALLAALIILLRRRGKRS